MKKDKLSNNKELWSEIEVSIKDDDLNKLRQKIRSILKVPFTSPIKRNK